MEVVQALGLDGNTLLILVGLFKLHTRVTILEIKENNSKNKV